MPDQDKVARIRELIKSEQDVEFFLEQLKTAEWIPLIKEAGLVDDPPAPIEVENGVTFPSWPPSRYFVRVANLDPAAVADTFYAVRDSANPRVWWDTVDALTQMPAEFTSRFVGHIKHWVHHPWRLGLDRSTAKLVVHLCEAGARQPAVELGVSLAAIVAPADLPPDGIWVPLDDYDYGTEVPKVAVALATFGVDPIFELVGELVRHLELEHSGGEQESLRDLSFIWKPAIEDHEQNWDHELPAKLVTAIRDGLESVLVAAPDQTESVINRLLVNPWPIVRRLGLHLLVVHGDRGDALVARALSDPQLMADGNYRHEFYRLAARRFDKLPDDIRRRYVENAHAAAAEDAERVAERAREEGRSDVDPSIARGYTLRRWLNVVADLLSTDDREELNALNESLPAEEHPDFASFHMSWMGFDSPLTLDEISDRPVEATIDFLSAWNEPADRFGPAPSVEGLAHRVSEAIAKQPDRYAGHALSFLKLDPRYFSSLVEGLWKALEGDKAFDWHEVLAACLQTFDASREESAQEDDGEKSWRGTRLPVARLLERGLENRPSQIPIGEGETAWALLDHLAEDPEPTPANEKRYGPPNMDPLTYSLNTVRGAAFHGIFLYLLWHERHIPVEGQAWSIADQDPAATAVLDSHLDPDVDPSLAVRATYGWWLPFLIAKDQGWVENRSRRLFGTLTTDLGLAAWETYLLRAWGSRREHELLASYFGLYADLLTDLSEKPAGRSLPGDPIERFIQLLVLAWLHRPDIRQGWPLRTLLASRRTWLIAEVVEESGRLISRTDADTVTTELVDSFKALWRLILDEVRDLDGDDLKNALGPFAWWFGSPLPGEWALTQLLGLMKRRIRPDPDFLVVERLPELAADQPDDVLRVLEYLATDGDREWTLRTHEDQIRAALALQVDAEDPLRRERARTLVHQLGRLGLRGLASLLSKPA